MAPLTFMIARIYPRLHLAQPGPVLPGQGRDREVSDREVVRGDWLSAEEGAFRLHRRQGHFFLALRSCQGLRLTFLQIAVQFWYEWHDKTGQWWRSYGLEDWTFADNGLMRKRQNSTNDVKISEEERWFKDGVDVNTVDISEKHW